MLGRKGRWPSQGGVTFSSAWTSPRIEMATAGVLRSSVMVPRLHRAAFVWRRRERARAPPLASAPRPRRVGSTAGDETSSAPLRLHPPPATPLPPRVEHVILGPDTSGPAASVLARLIPGEPRVDETTVRQLIAFGAVYHAETPPPRVLNGYPRHLRPRRVRDPDLLLTPGAYCRVHVHPKRFPAAAAVDWRARLIASSEDFVAVDKPPGVNVSMTVDNAVECVAQCVAAEMRADNPPTTIADASSSSDAEPPSWAESDPLVVTHRLDAATSGVLVLARTVDFARRFNDALRAKRVRKLYACLTLAPVPTGLMEHWTEETSEGPRRHIARELLPGDATWSPSADADADADERAFLHPDGRKRCVLRVLGCEPIDPRSLSEAFLEATRDTFTSSESGAPPAYESRVELVTGRTHQIRAQFAASGVPLVGDALYGAEESAARVLGAEDRLGLHAAELAALDAGTLGGEGATMRAGSPWWRR